MGTSASGSATTTKNVLRQDRRNERNGRNESRRLVEVDHTHFCEPNERARVSVVISQPRRASGKCLVWVPSTRQVSYLPLRRSRLYSHCHPTLSGGSSRKIGETEMEAAERERLSGEGAHGTGRRRSWDRFVARVEGEGKHMKENFRICARAPAPAPATEIGAAEVVAGLAPLTTAVVFKCACVCARAVGAGPGEATADNLEQAEGDGASVVALSCGRRATEQASLP